VEWSGPELVLPVADDESREPEHWTEYMDMQAYRVGGPKAGLWLGQLVVFDSDRSSEQYEMPTIPGVWRKGLTELRLLTSRDAGRTWQRVCGRDVWLPHHEDDAGFDRLVFSAAPLEVGDELRFYYPCFDGDHLVFNKDGSTFYKDRTRIGRTALATLRLDGYASLDAGGSGGELVTKLLRFEGKQLVVNASTSGGKGELRVEILHADGRPVAGYSAADCLPLRGDGVRQAVTWRERKDVAELAGKALQLRIVLKDAAAYGFAFNG
jgi:hypothetical protein